MMMVDIGSHEMDRSEDSGAPPGPPIVPPGPPGNVPPGPPDVPPGPPEGTTPPGPPVDVPRRRVQPPRPFGAEA